MTPDRVSVNVGTLLGYVILSLADALLPPVFIVGIVFLAVLLELWNVLVPYVLALVDSRSSRHCWPALSASTAAETVSNTGLVSAVQLATSLNRGCCCE
jgi:hypothetical protein